MVVSNISKRFIYILLGITAAIIFALPYLLLRQQIRQLPQLGYAYLFVVCIICGATLFIPTSVSILILSAVDVLNPWLCILCAAFGNTIGQQAAFFIGHIGSFGFNECKDRTGALYGFINRIKQHLSLAVFLCALLPLPFDDFVSILAGENLKNWLPYTIGKFSGKLIKYLLIVVLWEYVLPALGGRIPLLNEFIIHIKGMVGA